MTKQDIFNILDSFSWKRLIPLLEKHKVSFTWVRGHAGHLENERCDEIAVSQYRDRSAE